MDEDSRNGVAPRFVLSMEGFFERRSASGSEVWASRRQATSK